MIKKIFTFLGLCCVFMLQAQQDTLAIREHIEKLIDSSTIQYNQGNYAHSQKLNIEIVKNAEKIQDTGYLQNGYRYIAYDHLLLKDTLQAKINFEKAHNYAKLSKNKRDLALSNMDLANLYATSKQPFSKVMPFHNKSIEIFRTLKDSSNLGIAYFNTIETALSYQRYDVAYKNLMEGSYFINEYNPDYVASLTNLWAKYYLYRRDYPKVDAYLATTINDTLDRIESIDKELAYALQSQSYYAQKRYKEAFDAKETSDFYYAQNQKKLQNKEVQRLSATFQLEEYKKDLARTELEKSLQGEILKRQRQQNTLLIIITLSSLLLILFLFVLYRSRKKFIGKLKAKNKEYLLAKYESERLAKSKSKFFATVSHELRTPLYGVIGMSSVLLEDPDLSQKHQEDLKTLKFSADYLLALINDVLQISKIDAERVPKEERPFNIKELLRSILASFEYTRRQNQNTFDIQLDPKLPQMVQGNMMILSQILMNLIGNAVKFTENGTVTITIKRKNATAITISVKDDGPGIPLENQEEIFSEFSQLENKHAHEGTGLGLPIVSKLLHILGSKIHLESSPGEGSNFFFEYPIKEIAAKTQEVTPEVTVFDEDILLGKHILIVDDNAVNQVVTRKILEQSQVTCSIVNNGQEAVDLVQKMAFDLILMDLNMPVLNGFQATEKIRALGIKVPIIALTAVEADEIRHQVTTAGMDDFIIKPYDIDVFRKTICSNIVAIDKAIIV